MKANPRQYFRLIFLVTWLACCWGQSTPFNKLKEVYSWKSLEFAYPNEQAREADIRRGTYVPGASVPIDVDTYYGGKDSSMVFVSIPRFQDGIPVTLGYVTKQVSPEGNPIIAPYPSWDWQRAGNCDVITSVFRVQVDECGRLWVIDTGKVGDRRYCRPQILIFSLRTKTLIGQYKFPKDQFNDVSLFVTVTVDVRDPQGKCQDTFAYIADVTGFGLLVYDHRNSKSWRITNKLFYPYPPQGTFHIAGESFDLMDGILGLALSPIKSDGDRILYFHSLASKVESWVSTSIIRNRTIFEHDEEAMPRAFVPFDKKRSSQSAAQVMDRNGVLFFGLLSDLAIGCWNSRNYLQYGGTDLEVLATDSQTLQFPSGVKIVTSSSGRDELWILTSSFQKVMTGSISTNETNFRIQAAFVDEFVRGTKCDVAALGINGNQRPVGSSE